MCTFQNNIFSTITLHILLDASHASLTMLMFSAPPATTTFDSPSLICCNTPTATVTIDGYRTCAALTTAWKPEPQSRLTVSAAASTGTPDLRPMWRVR